MKQFSRTDTGILREMNQDYFFVSDTPIGNLPNLYIVADGMGGHKAGEYASRYTVERIVASVSKSPDKEPIPILRTAISRANELLIEEASEDPSKQGMGTTVVLATIYGRHMIVANVGDSRLYVICDRMRQVTRDHSIVEEMVGMGEMNEEEARHHPDKNIITRAVGAAERVVPDFFEVDLSEGDEVLLCTDGLTNMITDEEIYNIAGNRKESLESRVNTLVNKANHNGGRDNITVVIIGQI